MTRAFTVRRAVRRDVPLIGGLIGPPGSGKTLSALLLAQGIARVMGGRVKLLDTEGGRCRQYADDVDFDEVPFEAPYSPTDFLAAVRQLRDGGDCGCIVIDSQSDEHEGEGGVLDWHEREIDRMAGAQKDDFRRRDALSQAGWIKPKAARQAMVQGYLRLGVPLILNFRAREKTKPMKDEKGRTAPVNLGFVPIAPPEVIFCCSFKCLLPPFGQGVPTWESDKVGENFLLKLPHHFRAIFGEDRALTADMGAALATWARGDGASSPQRTHPLPRSRGAGAAENSNPSAAPDLYNYGELILNAADPVSIETPLPAELMESSDWRHWSKALAAMIKAAPEHLKPAWRERNAAELLRLQALHPSWVSALHDLVSPAATGESGASVTDGAHGGSGAPHIGDNAHHDG